MMKPIPAVTFSLMTEDRQGLEDLTTISSHQNHEQIEITYLQKMRKLTWVCYHFCFSLALSSFLLSVVMTVVDRANNCDYCKRHISYRKGPSHIQTAPSL